MATLHRTEIPQEEYIRSKVFSRELPPLKRYAQLVIGSTSIWELLRYEVITCLFGGIPGAVGLFLRKHFYPFLFTRIGRGVVFGRHITIRNPSRIQLGNNVILDDNCVLDGRGAADDFVSIGDEVIIHRSAVIQAKIGALTIGAHSDIGAQCTITSQGGTFIGAMVTLGGGCKIGGGLIRLASDGEQADGSPNDFVARGQQRFTRGPVRIEDGCVFGGGAMVLDGVTVGTRSVIGAASVVREDIPARSVVMPDQRLLVVPREHFGEASQQAPDNSPPAGGSTLNQDHPAVSEGTTHDDALEVVHQALDLLNEQLPPQRRIQKLADEQLFEPEGPLDSLGLINLVVNVEGELQRRFGKPISLVDASTMDNSKLPFSTVGTLLSYVRNLLTEKIHAP